LIIFDASALVSAALKADSGPERAPLRAKEVDVFALSTAVDGEIARVLSRPRFARTIPLAPRQQKEAIRRRAQGATLDELARSYKVSRAEFKADGLRDKERPAAREGGVSCL
jgi:predicted nucleic acid-binding protein